jgi:Tn3 transposase DDE domain-containing protein
MLQELETELEARYETVNRRILSGGNTQIKLKQKNGETLWTLLYPSGEDTVNDPLFDGLPQIHVAQLLQFVDRRCHCLDAFTHILSRYVKTTLDRQTVVACLIAYGTNVGPRQDGRDLRSELPDVVRCRESVPQAGNGA